MLCDWDLLTERIEENDESKCSNEELSEGVGKAKEESSIFDISI